jgi:heavy metal sensor kinase
MKSIRLSLILFILLLQTVALVTVLALFYQTTSDTLVEKNQDTNKHLKAENMTRRASLSAGIDSKILALATELSSLAQSRWGLSQRQLDSLWAAQTMGQLWTGTYSTVTWMALSPDGTITPYLLRRPFVEIVRADDVINREREAGESDYFKIYNQDGNFVQQSASLKDESFDLDPTMRAKVKLFGHIADDIVLKNGARLRRVTLKMPVSTVKRTSTRLMLDGRDSFHGPFGVPISVSPPAQPYWTVPAFYIQYARDVRLRDEALLSYDSQFAGEVQRHEDESAEKLASLQRWVFGVGLAVFAITTIGACWLISVGLTPLKRLSDAVSRVSPRDFRLPADPKPTPHELQPIYQRLTETLEMLERAFAREKQASADISHELRTPLTALLTTLDVGLRRPRSPEQYTELLRDCRIIGRQLSQLVERLLALARLDAGADSVRPQEVDVSALAAQCVALVRPLAEARDLSIALHATAPATLITDANKLREIITNLLHNAVEYNKPNGRIDVSVERENGHMNVHVQDSGIGISPKAVSQIFERFYRVDESRQADTLHAGLGLAIVKSYLDLLGGRIHVNSREGEGSTFSVELPAN